MDERTHERIGQENTEKLKETILGPWMGEKLESLLFFSEISRFIWGW